MNTDYEKTINIRRVVTEDAPTVHNLVNSCPPLDKNSRYLYLLVCTHFNEYSMVAEHADDIVGFISAYRHPHLADTIFIWQVAVSPDYRKYGIASRMLNEIVKYSVSDGLSYLETTVTPSNTASFNMFKKLADNFNAGLSQIDYFSRTLLGKGHEKEMLIRIGPIIKTGGN
jgi:L-2,4-diaminobutyric acid acetyltransferase